MIAIDFQGGQHGNFLEFVCNRHLAGIECRGNPFNQQGASHRKLYLSPKVFQCGHFFMDNPPWPADTDKIVSVRITKEDLLPLSAISLLRAGDFGYDNNDLEINTYNKFNNQHYRPVLDTLLNSFFNNRFKEAYDAVKDPSWPTVTDDSDFDLLPNVIQQECKEKHGIMPLQFDKDHPHCPRNILREFFKLGFCYPENSGFMSVQRQKMIYRSEHPVLHFEFSCFYEHDKFLDKIVDVGQFTNLQIRDLQGLIDLHQEFLALQPYKNIKSVTDNIYQQVIDGKRMVFQDLNLLQESYLDAKFEVAYGREAPADRLRWFENSDQLRAWFCG